MKEVKQHEMEEQEQMYQGFINVCAVNIQRAYRGHVFRKNKLLSIRIERKAEERFRAFVKAWKVRKVMQTKEIFKMGSYIKDITRVQEYFVYIEKCDNMMLLKQLKKDRRKAIESYLDTIEHLLVTGEWVKSYIGN